LFTDVCRWKDDVSQTLSATCAVCCPYFSAHRSVLECQRNNEAMHRSANLPDSAKSTKVLRQQHYLTLVQEKRSIYNNMVNDAKLTVAAAADIETLAHNELCSNDFTMHYMNYVIMQYQKIKVVGNKIQAARQTWEYDYTVRQRYYRHAGTPWPAACYICWRWCQCAFIRRKGTRRWGSWHCHHSPPTAFWQGDDAKALYRAIYILFNSEKETDAVLQSRDRILQAATPILLP